MIQTTESTFIQNADDPEQTLTNTQDYFKWPQIISKALNKIFMQALWPEVQELRFSGTRLGETVERYDIEIDEPQDEIRGQYFITQTALGLEQDELVRAATYRSQIDYFTEQTGLPYFWAIESEYEGFAEDMVDAARAMIADIKPTFQNSKVRNIDQYYRNFIQNRTAGGSIEAATIEGIQTIVAVMSMLTVEKVEGYEDPLMLAGDIVENQILNTIGAKFRNGILIPTTKHGIYIKNPLSVNQGHLALSERFQSVLHSETEKRHLLIREFANRKRFSTISFNGCPFAKVSRYFDINGAHKAPDSGLNIMARKFLEYLEIQKAQRGLKVSEVNTLEELELFPL